MLRYSISRSPASVDRGGEIAEVALEAAQHVVRATDVPPLHKREGEVVEGQADEGEELLVEAVVARQADAAAYGGAGAQALLEAQVAVVERDEAVGGDAAVDVHVRLSL